jgi:hypothetical protein
MGTTPCPESMTFTTLMPSIWTNLVNGIHFFKDTPTLAMSPFLDTDDAIEKLLEYIADGMYPISY